MKEGRTVIQVEVKENFLLINFDNWQDVDFNTIGDPFLMSKTIAEYMRRISKFETIITEAYKSFKTF